MTESLLLQESGSSGYFTLEDGAGRLLLEISVPAEPAGGSSGGYMDEELMVLALLRRDDEEIAVLVAAIS